jgi:tRNA (cmo5U34)-methyltransferase
MDNLTAHKASEYDAKVRHTIPFYDIIQREVLRLVQAVKPNAACWVDTGCGTGFLVELALAVFPQTRFVLADPSEAMLTQARRRFERTGAARVQILGATDSAGLTTHLERGVAEVVTAVQCHHYLQAEGRRQAVQACFELLAPGGLFVAFENVAPRTPDATRIGLDRWKSFLLAEGRTEAEADNHLARYGTGFSPITVQEHLQLLTQTGFRVVELLWFSQMQAGFYGIR